MNKNKTISTKSLNQAMKSSNRRAIRTNKALGLDTVYVKGNNVIREHADGSKSTIKKLNGSSSKSPTIKGILKIG
jgi:methionine synthase II (cobalamin-independent)